MGNNNATLLYTPEELAEVDEIFNSREKLPVALVEEKKSLDLETEKFHNFAMKGFDSKETDAEGRALYTFDGEAFHRENEAIAAKTNAFMQRCEPIRAAWEIEKRRRIAEVNKRAARRPGNGAGAKSWEFGDGEGGEKSIKSLYDVIGESDAFKSLLGRIPTSGNFNEKITIPNVPMGEIMEKERQDTIAAKATFSTSAGFPLPTNRSDLVVPYAHRKPVAADYIPSVQWDQQIYPYLQQTTWTNTAAPVAEGQTKPEAAIAYTQVIAYLEVIAATLPITKQVQWFAPDVIKEMMQNDVIDMVRLAEDQQIFSGTGTRPQLQGIGSQSGIQTYARLSAENNMDAIFRADQLVRFTGYADPDVRFIAPDNYTTIALTKDLQGRYLFGDPHTSVGINLWGIPLVQTNALTDGTAYTGDFAHYARLIRHMSIMVTMGYINTDFVQNLLRMLVEELVGLVVTRPAAFASITNLS